MTYDPYPLDHAPRAAPGLQFTPAQETGEHFYYVARFLTGLVFYPVVCSLGLAGNILIIIVLSRKQMRSSTSSYLIGWSRDAEALRNGAVTLSVSCDKS